MRILHQDEFPPQLLEIPQVPDHLYIKGELPSPDDYIYVSVVGSRKHTSYGKDACEKIIRGLKGYPFVIVSGLALGIDSIAHKTALEVGLPTIAIPGSGLDDKVLYPSANRGLADLILRKGGCILSEFEPDFRATLWSFPKRNRIVAGISRAVIVIEAPEKSGALITVRMAVDYNRDVFAVPGSIFSDTSKGTNKFIKLGATPLTCAEDILNAFGLIDPLIPTQQTFAELEDISEDEKKLLELLDEPLSRDELIGLSQMSSSNANAIISLLEIKGLISESLGKIRKIM
ncbi:MAG: DNA-processing protein DprA [Candidatus Pacebacteria bacterium]|nr:DNA-processing protein DprA [Candidatus Paceibacterota bacterium]MBP9780300.1 DNA-processing protein DprA [Candidatus Paceibacterota bacterium]